MAKWSSATQTEDIALLIEKKIKIALYGASKSSELPRWRTKTKLSSRSSDCDGPSKQLFHSVHDERWKWIWCVSICVWCVCAATCLPHGLWVLCWLYVTHEWWDMESIDYDAVECHRHRRERVKDEDWCNFGRYERVKRLVWMMLIWLCLLLFISSCQFVSLSTDFPNYWNIFLAMDLLWQFIELNILAD